LLSEAVQFPGCTNARMHSLSISVICLEWLPFVVPSAGLSQVVSLLHCFCSPNGNNLGGILEASIITSRKQEIRLRIYLPFLTRQNHKRLTLLRVAAIQITEPARFQCLTSRGTRKCGSPIEMDEWQYESSISAYFSLSRTHGHKHMLLDTQVCSRVPPVYTPRTALEWPADNAEK
jgi:hypothetical protein